ncbi:MAG: tRNA (adenosine(37)-N6)-threonylcarbamoyltransferase complex transferase subunit TsaD [Nitrososphaeria archaeon]|nr:tRNA (adenosine(37)-N6)-threonylcarbamoyltransferase complex transferase subunit TsaD [Nitrososphaeria archaeon]
MRRTSGTETTIMGVESTAHTFGVSVIDERFNVLADVRKIMPFTMGRGIHPHEAAEHHAKVAHLALNEVLEKAKLEIRDLGGIAYSAGPGLGPSLRVGATVVRAISAYLDIPLYPVHHGLGHIELAVRLTNVEDPLVVLVSGGHTAITGFSGGRWRIYGETLDITLGNLLDQFARRTGISGGTMGGPAVERAANEGNLWLDLPYTVKGNNVVYSGLLTYVLKLVGRESLEDLCYSLQETAFAMLTEATERAFIQLGKKEIILAGGVALNKRLQAMMNSVASGHGSRLHTLDERYHPDNGVQIALLGLYYHMLGLKMDVEDARVRQRWRLDEVDIPWRRKV